MDLDQLEKTLLALGLHGTRPQGQNCAPNDQADDRGAGLAHPCVVQWWRSQNTRLASCNPAGMLFL